MSLRNDCLDAVVGVIADALDQPQDWGSFPARTVERKYANLVRLGNRLRVLVLDDDGSRSPVPAEHDGGVDDEFNFHLRIQVNEPAGPSPLAHAAMDAIKRALRAAVHPDGALWPYSKLPLTFEFEAVLLPEEGEGRFAEFVLPCTVLLPDNLGGFAAEEED